MRKKLIKIIFIILAFIFVGLGILGVILPILPTTPFLLAASYFFAKGSDRFHNWFVSTKLYKNYLQDFIETRAMTLKAKLKILIPVSIMLIISFLMIDNLYAKGLIVFLFLFKEYYFRFHIETISEERKSKLEEVE